MKYDDHYREQARLDDGTEVLLRLVRPEDRDLLARGFAHLSTRTIVQRFLGARGQLSDAELAYLTDVDGRRHFALGATSLDEKEGYAIARFVREQDDADVAEPAIVVVDSMQGRGLGKLLLGHLVEAARERGVRAFRAEILADNEPMRNLVAELAPDAVVRGGDGLIDVEMPLPEAAPPQRGPLYRLLGLAAEGVISVRRAFDWLLSPTTRE